MVYQGKRISKKNFVELQDDLFKEIKPDKFKKQIAKFNSFVMDKHKRKKKEYFEYEYYAIVEKHDELTVIRYFKYETNQYITKTSFYEIGRDFMEINMSITRCRNYSFCGTFRYLFDLKKKKWNINHMKYSNYNGLYDEIAVSKLYFMFDFYGKQYLRKLDAESKMYCFLLLNDNPRYEILFKYRYFKRVDMSKLSNKQLVFIAKNKLERYEVNTLIHFQTYDLEFIRKVKCGYNLYHERILNVVNDKFRFIRFVKTLKNGIDMQNYYDYIDNLITLNLELNNKNLFNKDYERLHQIYINIINQKKREKEEEEMKKYVNLYKDYALELIKEYEREDELYFYIPRDVNEFYNEAMHQHNCLYSNHYYKKVFDRKSIIIFVRKLDKKDTPFIDLELCPKTLDIKQCYATMNSNPEQKYLDIIKRVVENYKQERKQKNIKVIPNLEKDLLHTRI